MRNESLYTNNLTKEYINTTAIRDLNISVYAGEFAAVIGISGSGKNTLTSILMGEDYIYDGKIFVAGNEFHARNIQDAQTAGIYCIRNKSNLIKSMSVAENMLLFRGKQRQFSLVKDKFIQNETQGILSQYGLKVESTELVQNLSDIMQCIVEMIKFAEMGAKVIVLYDVFNNSNEAENKIILNIIKILQEQNIGLLYLTNCYIDIIKNAQRLYVLRDGRLARTLFSDEYTLEQLNNFMIGYEYPKVERDEGIVRGDEILRVKNINVGSLKNISFSVHAHEVFGILDTDIRSGDALVQALFGLIPYTGEVFIRSKYVELKNSVEAAKHGIGIIPADSRMTLFNDLSVVDNVSILIQNRMCVIPGVINRRIEKLIHIEVKKMLNGMENYDTIYGLRHEEQVNLMVSKFLICPHNVIMIIRPSLNYDIIETKKIYDLIESLRQEDCSIIFVSSRISEVKAICDNILVLEKGDTKRIICRNEFAQLC